MLKVTASKGGLCSIIDNFSTRVTTDIMLEGLEILPWSVVFYSLVRLLYNSNTVIITIRKTPSAIANSTDLHDKNKA